MLSDKLVQAISPQSPQGTNQNRPLPTQIDSRSSVTMDAIKSYILRHGLHPGDRLPTESALCADLGVSRSSVREALRRLQALDIVTVRQGSGSYVGEMSMQPLVETLVLRAALDEINGAQSLHAIIDTRRALDLGIAVPLTRAMKGTTNPHLWELVEAMTEYAHSGSTYLEQRRARKWKTPPRPTRPSCEPARPATSRHTPPPSRHTTPPSSRSLKVARAHRKTRSVVGARAPGFLYPLSDES